ncbi:MAG: hypothetical protein JSU86_03530 [Phycisphaerales bacterium]|nr:MAG: hypothetical protein JSU86_03530 [Phycisphaerales bacterium]
MATSAELIEVLGDTGGPYSHCCGNSLCEEDEDPRNCPDDCGESPAYETSCHDGMDSECDGFTDCEDADCAEDSACIPALSGWGLTIMMLLLLTAGKIVSVQRRQTVAA